MSDEFITTDELEKALEVIEKVHDELDEQLARRIEKASSLNLANRMFEHEHSDIEKMRAVALVLRKIIRWRTS